MAEESEKRFTAIMEKLFQAPPTPKHISPATCDSGVQLSRGNKQLSGWSGVGSLELKLRGNLVEESQKQSGTMKAIKPPLCRPWDHGDFFRRLATFKSMTWFAKPQAVSAVNCARRGWINVDFDTIECEACGARLLMSTPQSWSQEQVEKSALVFCLKLDSGHKLLCPWVDNICDEGLTRFPPTQTAILVDEYKTRCSALLQLLALPVITSSAINHMRSPLLEGFLEEQPMGECSESVETSGIDQLGHEPDIVSSVSYYQAQKLISLCGWEPHPLPYTVGCKEGQNQFINNANLAVSSHQNHSTSLFPLSADGSTEPNYDAAYTRLQFDPNSVVLYCSLCGAKVGLWAFSTISRPMECLRLVGHTDVDDNNDPDLHKEQGPGVVLSSSGSHVAGSDFTSTDPKSLDEGPSKLNLTIAGGPPPTKQNYRAIISLPVIGRNLRAQFLSDSVVKKDHSSFKNLTDRCKDQDMLLEGTFKSSEANSNTENPSTSSQAPLQDSCDTDRVPRIGSVVEADLGTGMQYGSQVGSNTKTTAEDNITGTNGSHSENFMQVAEAQNLAAYDDSQESRQVEPNVLPADHKCLPSVIEKVLEVLPDEKAMGFDPIRQHRAFCPWISSSGDSAPGWQQTLSALHRQKEFAYPFPENMPSFSIEVDDPIASVRKLLTPPSSKRAKLTHPH